MPFDLKVEGTRMLICWWLAGVLLMGTKTAVLDLNEQGKKVALAHFTYINPLPRIRQR